MAGAADATRAREAKAVAEAALGSPRTAASGAGEAQRQSCIEKDRSPDACRSQGFVTS